MIKYIVEDEVHIAISRALKLGSKDEYVVGYYIYNNFSKEYWIRVDGLYDHLIDTSTLAIHFPDMLDLNNKPIFASLSESGKGGDILLFDDGRDIRELVCMYRCYTLDLVPIKIIKDSYKFNGCTLPNGNVKVIGIQQ